ncbi:hypothetical protein [Acinetobacter sp. TUM15512]|nr:hypothetical protein [Acinetobacter sp. TUM15512]
MSSLIYFVEDFFEVADSMSINYEILSENKSQEKLYSLFSIYSLKDFELSINRNNLKEIPIREFLDRQKINGKHLPNGAGNKELLLELLPDNIGEVFYSFDFKDYNRLVKFKNFCDLKVILSQVYNFNYYIFDNSN